MADSCKRGRKSTITKKELAYVLRPSDKSKGNKGKTTPTRLHRVDFFKGITLEDALGREYMKGRSYTVADFRYDRTHGYFIDAPNVSVGEQADACDPKAVAGQAKVASLKKVAIADILMMVRMSHVVIGERCQRREGQEVHSREGQDARRRGKRRRYDCTYVPCYMWHGVAGE
tara:strand:- start:52 stop:570 length:519 start_codon:yes stop_codon:yes gene_type:complete